MFETDREHINKVSSLQLELKDESGENDDELLPNLFAHPKEEEEEEMIDDDEFDEEKIEDMPVLKKRDDADDEDGSDSEDEFDDEDEDKDALDQKFCAELDQEIEEI
eukprot:4929231-Ditylum_brightwellii.AAC.1